jgi:hypothetical protein
MFYKLSKKFEEDQQLYQRIQSDNITDDELYEILLSENGNNLGIYLIVALSNISSERTIKHIIKEVGISFFGETVFMNPNLSREFRSELLKTLSDKISENCPLTPEIVKDHLGELNLKTVKNNKRISSENKKLINEIISQYFDLL